MVCGSEYGRDCDMAAGRAKPKMRTIDIHNHPNWQGHDTDALVADMDRNRIAQTWLLSWEMPAEEFEAAPHYYDRLDPRAAASPREAGLPLWMVVEGMQRHPGRLIGGWAPDPRDRHARARLQAAVALHGIRVYGELKCRMRYDSPDAISMFRFCAALRLPVLFHLEAPAYRLRRQSAAPYPWTEWYGGEIGVVDTMCRLCPDTRFIGHGPGFWRELSADDGESDQPYPDGPVGEGGALPRLLRTHANLYADLSAGSGGNALKRDRPHARRFLDEFQDRVMFGRDTFNCDLYDILVGLRLPQKIMRKILYGNAGKILG
jgi:predicted TIM-barrel fold metal-dependent hydrolase